jgi:hypothetical protein
MSEDNHQRWLIDRADHLRSTCASSAGFLVTANAVAVSAMTFLTRSLWDAVTTASATPTSATPWHLWAQLGLFGLAWIALGASVIRSVAAVAAANGFSLGYYPSQRIAAPLLMSEVSPESMQVLPLEDQLKAATLHLAAAQANLRNAGFNLVMVPVIVFASFFAQGLVNDWISD